MSKPWKYHTVLLIEERLPLINSAGAHPVQHFGTILAGNLIWVLTNLVVQYVVLQILCLLFTSSLNVCLFLLMQTCHCLAKHAECYWAHRQTAWVRDGVYDSSRQLDSITPTRESFVRDRFKVGFSTLYFPSTCAQTLPKHLLQQSHYGPKDSGHKLLTLEDAARPAKLKRRRNTNSVTGYYVMQPPFWPVVTQSKT